MALQLFCTNFVEDFVRFRPAFDADLPRARTAGLDLVALWRDADRANAVHFLFEVEDRARAEAFMASPESAVSGLRAGVTGGDYHWLETVD
ncbi:MAG: hypothetical protein V2J24_02460 [Pseudomonadales bacterium]|jgi:hypothetical protein|nr:hypothetical protein [Pseudomonadales bacterium]